MQYYELFSDVDRFKWVTCRQKHDQDRVCEINPTRISQDWRPVKLATIEESARDRKLPIGDFPVFWPTAQCLSKRAAAALTGYLLPAGEFLDVKGLGDNYVLWHHVVERDALVPKETNWLPRHGRRLTLRAAFLTGDVFGLLGNITSVVVPEGFKKLVENEDLMGFEFQEVDQV